MRPADTPSPNGQPRANVARSFAAFEPVDPVEAAQLAAMFACDYLSWDEDEPGQRSEVLRRYLPRGADTTLGWSGTGRQRADFALPGTTMVLNGYIVLVDVRVRATPYERVTADTDTDTEAVRRPTAAAGPPDGSVWSSAPAPVARGWTSGRSAWTWLSVPVRRHDSGGLVIDLSPIPEPDREERL